MMKHPLAFLALLPSLLFATSEIWDGTADITWYNTSETEFTITTAEQLAGLVQLVNSGTSMDGKTIKLGNDIALNDTTDWKNWATSNSELKPWTPIGSANARRFYGTFDGDGYTVSGVYINGNSWYQGLFGYTNGSTIRNLGMVASYIKGGENVGGLVASNTGSIINCYAIGNVFGTRNVGGLAGGNGGTISNSHAIGNVEGSYVGGLVGSNGGTISNSHATGNVSGTISTGGLAGLNDGGTITDSYTTGNVSGANTTGGLVGLNNNSGTITNSYTTGNVSGANATGGLVGVNNTSGTITNSYYNTETSEQSDVGKGIGRTSAQMRSKSYYFGWNFDEIWEIDQFSNNGMPYFQWQNTMRLVQVATIQDQLYTGSQITPRPEVTAPDGTKLEPGKDFDYYYGENIHVQNGGMVYIVSKPEGAYYGTKTVPFTIKPIKTVTVTWSPPCGTATSFTYNGQQQGPTPTATGYSLEADLETNAAIGLTAIARLVKANPEDYDDVVLQNEACTYTIAPKTLEVSWAAESIFTYNKMPPPLKPTVAEPGVSLLLRAFVNVGKYSGETAASVEIEDQEQARNYNLTNRTKNYEILKKDLKPYFTDTLPDFSTNKADTLWVPHEVFNDSATLHSALSTLIDYDGFATDTTKATPESDNASVLKGAPKVTLQYTRTSLPTLNRRVETSQKATATIVTDDISADNYALTRPAIVIMATIEEDENADKIFCRLGNSCAQFSEAVCSAISGQPVENCNFNVACVINGTCVKDFPFETCSAMKGEAFSTCEEAPVLRPVLSSNAFRV